MRKFTRRIVTMVALFILTLGVSAQTSSFCNAPSGHLGDPNFGAAASHVFITITNVNANTVSVTLTPRTATGGAVIDFMQVNASGIPSVIVGTDEGAVLAEYTALLTYEVPPTSITMEILWSNPGWTGRWMVQNITVPFNASCTGGPVVPPAPVVHPTINYQTVGNDWAWTIFENGDNSPTLYSVVPNPAPGGINTSSHVAMYTVNANGMPWAGLWSNDMTDFTFTAENSIVRVMVYKSVISNFTVKFENENASVNFERQVANTVVNQWQELTFDFTPFIGSRVTRLVIIPDFPASRTAGSINYWDNISFNSGAAPVLNVPTALAPLPTMNASNVISLHSRAYTNVGVDTWRTGWSNATFSDFQVANHPVKRYTNLVFTGIETTGANLINATGMTHFHLNLWTPDMTTFRVKLVDFGANAVWGGGDDVEHELTFNPALSTWVSLNIPLSDFTGLVTRRNIAQLIFSGAPTGTVFIDNIYFYNSISTNVENTSIVKPVVYSNQTGDMLHIRATNEIKQAEVFNLAGVRLMTQSLMNAESTLNIRNLVKGNYLLRLTSKDGQVSTHKFIKN